MKIILLRFESEKIHFLECNISDWIIVIWDKSKILFDNSISRWEKYSMIFDELNNLKQKYLPDYFSYQSPMKYRWAIKDEEGYVYSALLHLFCEKNNSNILELTWPIIRNKINLSAKDLKEKLEWVKNNILENYKIAKSDKLLDGFIYLTLLKDHLD